MRASIAVLLQFGHTTVLLARDRGSATTANSCEQPHLTAARTVLSRPRMKCVILSLLVLLNVSALVLQLCEFLSCLDLVYCRDFELNAAVVTDRLQIFQP